MLILAQPPWLLEGWVVVQGHRRKLTTLPRQIVFSLVTACNILRIILAMEQICQRKCHPSIPNYRTQTQVANGNKLFLYSRQTTGYEEIQLKKLTHTVLHMSEYLFHDVKFFYNLPKNITVFLSSQG